MAKLTKNEARIKRHARVRLNLSGTAERPRLNVFRSLDDDIRLLLRIEQKNERNICYYISWSSSHTCVGAGQTENLFTGLENASFDGSGCCVSAICIKIQL